MSVDAIARGLAKSALNASGGRTLIEDFTATGVESSKTFSTIAQTYRALRLEWVARGTVAATTAEMRCRFNGDATAIYDNQVVAGFNGTTAAAAEAAQTSALLGLIVGSTGPANEPGVGYAQINNYQGTAFRKSGYGSHTYKTSDAAAGLATRHLSLYWRNTPAISSLTVLLASGNFVSGSVIRLYGLA